MTDRPFKTVIGSYPSDFNKLGLVAIREAVNDQLQMGIDLISDGQTRTDMVSYYAKSIDGFKAGGDKPRIVEKVGSPHPNTLIKDFRLARLLLPEDKEIKGILTGPVTMAFSSTIEASEYKGYRDPKLYMDIAEALLEIGKKFEEEGASWIQIDEPYYSVGAPMELAKEALEHITSGLKVPVALHVCGDITKVFTKLLGFGGISVLSHAFMGYRNNMKVLDKEALESNGKKIGFGCIDTQTTRVETKEEVAELVKSGVDKVGWGNLIFHPDCGLRALGRDVALSKLEAMSKGVDEVFTPPE
jgi:5-methyltetrahydropteroyltriglutamate--homocysteine methyltransferase